jgi:hypothetical protein
MMTISGLHHTARSLAVYASQPGLPRHHARLAPGCWPALPGGAGYPQGPIERFPLYASPFPELSWRTQGQPLYRRPPTIVGSCPFDIPSPSRAGSMSPSGGRGARWPTPVKHELSISREVKGELRLGSEEHSRLCSGTHFVSGTRATRRLRLRSPSSRPPPLPHRSPWRAGLGARPPPPSTPRPKFH